MVDRAGFPLVGEALSVDLVNTLARSGGTDRDLLDSPAALGQWLTMQAGRLAWPGATDAADLAAVRGLRDAVAALLTAHRTGTTPPSDTLAALNEALAVPVAPRLVWTATGPQAHDRTGASPRVRLLHDLAADAVALLTGPDARLLRTCEHPDCILQFVARNPRRRWCSAAGCGNRARVARHYSRRRGTAS